MYALLSVLISVVSKGCQFTAGHLKAISGGYFSAVLCLACIMLAAALLASLFPSDGATTITTIQPQYAASGKAVQNSKHKVVSEDSDIERADAASAKIKLLSRRKSDQLLEAGIK
jgi:hypothetical protein